jgi:hypothetical protein
MASMERPETIWSLEISRGHVTTVLQIVLEPLPERKGVIPQLR